MIDLYTFAPDRLNLNGDQANLLVLQKRLEWMGESSGVIAISTLADLDELRDAARKNPKGKFLLIGHGSVAAMNSLSQVFEALRALVTEFSELGIPVVAVGSGYELLSSEIQRGARRSEFVVVDFQGAQYLGYVNTDTDLPLIVWDGSILKTMLHGPVLAKNPHLADSLLSAMGCAVKANDRTEEVDAIVAKAWELEAQS